MLLGKNIFVLLVFKHEIIKGFQHTNNAGEWNWVPETNRLGLLSYHRIRKHIICPYQKWSEEMLDICDELYKVSCRALGLSASDGISRFLQISQRHSNSPHETWHAASDLLISPCSFLQWMATPCFRETWFNCVLKHEIVIFFLHAFLHSFF